MAIEQVSGSGGFEPINRAKVNKSQKKDLLAKAADLSSSVHASSTESPVDFSTNVRKELVKFGSQIESSLQHISRGQSQQQSLGKMSEVLSRIEALHTEYQNVNPEGEVAAAQNNIFAFERVNLHRVIKDAVFNAEALIQPTGALKIMTQSDSLNTLGDAASSALADIDAMRQDAQAAIDRYSTELGEAQVALRNFDSIGSPQSTDEMTDVMASIARDLSAQNFDLDRSNIASILGDVGE